MDLRMLLLWEHLESLKDPNRGSDEARKELEADLLERFNGQ